jgi:hypothetical protein
MNLTRDEVVTAYNCVAAVMRGFNTAPAPWAVANLFDRLNDAFRMSRAGHAPEGHSGESEVWICTREAAEELNLSPRQTRRLKPDLDGKMFNGRLMFRASSVCAYAEGRRNG